MNRCFFIATPGGEGAVAYHFMALGEALAAKGHSVVMLIDGQRKEKERHEGNPLIYTWPSKRPIKFRDAYFLFKLIGKFHPDCLIANFGATNVMMLVGWLRGVAQRFCWYHTLTKQIALDFDVPPWKTKLLRMRKKLVYKVATRIVPVSMAALRDLTSHFGISTEKCHVIYNSISDPLSYMIDGSVNESGPKKIICAGRLDFSKGQDILLKAVSILNQQSGSDNFGVEFVGDGPLRDYYEELATKLNLDNFCSFTGRVSPNEVLSRMASAYVSVVPSREEAFGLVNIESMALGTPVVASKVGGIPEIIRDGIDGFLIPPGDPHALADKLRQLMANPPLRDAMGKQARQHFLESFELQDALAGQVEWIESLVEKKP